MIHVAETRSLRRSPPRRCTSTHLASPSLQAWVYEAHAGTLNVNRNASARPIMLPGGTVKAGRGRGRRRSCWALNREHRLVASTVLSVADARRRHGDLDGDVDIAAALREPTGSCAPRSPTTCCMPLECFGTPVAPAEPSYGVSHLQRETGRLVLVLEAVVLRGLCELGVVLVVPIRALLDIAGNQAAADIGHPVDERDVVCDPFGRHGVPYQQGRAGQSPVTLAMTESQTSTIGVAGIPLNRDEVTVV